MSLPPEKSSLFEDTSNRLAGESILARAGSDEGLIPSYSLSAELLEIVAGMPAVEKPLRELQAALGKLLDEARPFDEVTLGHLRRVAEWLPSVLEGGAEAAPSPAMPAPQETPAGGTPPGAPADDHDAQRPEACDTPLHIDLEENGELLAEFHAEALDHLMQIEASLLTLDSAPQDRPALDSLFRSFHTIKGVSGFLHLTPMHTLTHEVESLLDLIRMGKRRLTPTIITEILRSRDAVQGMVRQIAIALEQGRVSTEIVKVSHLIGAVRRLASGAEDAGPADAGQKPKPDENASASAAEPAAADAGGRSGSASGAASTVRVNTEKLDALMDVVGELVIVQSQLQESSRAFGEDGSPLARNLGQLHRITKDIQETVMSLRMVPVKPMFQRMGRLVRDLCRACDKRARFVTSGEETEIDRTVVEEITDPLVHMVRNALDHGLEPEAGRVAAGKDPTGTLTLEAYHEGSSLVIELQDDGRGIDPEKILAKAKAKGLVAEGATLAREEIINLIFHAGFSTAEKVTSVSGRGVGMDVVKRNIEKLRGTIQIESEVGRGSTFRVRLPLTTAIIDGLLVRVGADHFILPSTMVQMALRPSRSALSTIQGQGETLDHRGKFLPLHRLHRRFGILEAVEDPSAGIVVIVENAGRSFALLVDELINKQEVVVKNLGSFLQSIPGVAGGAILGDGNIALILDPSSLCAA
ncbi:chemotaxis protein CheA [Termitidicoccus mucosus]|uniref:Chemotaxis protein CheA n=1 Tax=Termitidicoccus mucosus TaxID=1184151 RepID=A0A178IHH8_9BACT|nr:chemotaxis protein CheA [Opitutaceae bacterium TSB47]